MYMLNTYYLAGTWIIYAFKRVKYVLTPYNVSYGVTSTKDYEGERYEAIFKEYWYAHKYPGDMLMTLKYIEYYGMLCSLRTTFMHDLIECLIKC